MCAGKPASIVARPEEVLLTMGAQNALWMVAELLLTPERTAVVENPAYPGLRVLLDQRVCGRAFVDVDADGLPPDLIPTGADLVFTTPSHQCPTGVTMPLQRREALLRLADEGDFVVIEDDFESENRFDGEPIPALKSLDRNDRVVYIGSLSKSWAPGLRLGYVVAPAELIAELRALRRLMLRHPSAFIQRTFALFLSLGHHDAQLRRIAIAQRERCDVAVEAMARHAPQCTVVPVTGGGSCWIRLPEGVSAVELASRAAAQGVLIEPGDVFFHDASPPGGYIRLGYQSIPAKAIEAGIRILAGVIAELQRGR